MKTNTKRVAIILAVASTIGVLFQLFYLNRDRSAIIRLKGGRTSFNSESDVLSLEELHSLVSETNGFYARDWSLWLGWNNMRYIIEAAVLHAQILNRTLVLPSFIYARGCEYENEACAAFYDMVNRNDALESDEWRDLPPQQQMGWVVPLASMVDLPLLRQIHPVILVAEYLKLHGLPTTLEHNKGTWDRDAYHSGEYIFPSEKKGWLGRSLRPSLSVIVNEWFDPGGVVRVDTITDEMKLRGEWNSNKNDASHGRKGEWKEILKDTIYDKLENARGGDPAIDLLRARKILEENGVNISTEEQVIRALQDHGWEVLYTYEGQFYEHMKTVSEPLTQVAPRSAIRGLLDDFASVTDDVLLLEGEVHWNRKSGNLRFTTQTARSKFTRTVLHFIQPPRRVVDLVEELRERMKERVGGRLWMGAHMRRGDFLRIGWSSAHAINSHLDKVKNALSGGRRKILELQRESTVKTFDVPDVIPNTDLLKMTAPEAGDFFYLATDERSPDNIKFLKEHSAILLEDLLEPDDRRRYGPELVLTDILGLVDQALLSRSAYFYGTYVSSLSGGVLNARAALGYDSRTHYLDR